MRKIVSIIAALCVVATALFAVSYTNNTYHKLAEEYTEKAQKALDAGYYELAEEYAAEAKKNAALSEEFIAMMIAKTEAEEAIEKAKARLNESLEMGADPNSKEYTSSLSYLNKAQEEYENEEYPEAKADAEKVMKVLSDEYLAKLAEENAEKNAAKEAIAKAKEALDKALESGVPEDSEAYKSAKDFYDQAVKDFDNGDYVSAKENAENAMGVLDGDTVKNILAMKEAEQALAKAKDALDKAEKAGMDNTYPLYDDAKNAYEQAQKDFADSKYPETIENCNKVLDLLSDDNIAKSVDEAKKAAEDALANAKKALDEAEENGIDKDSDTYKKALEAYNKAKDELANNEYKEAKADAEKVNEILNDDLLAKLKETKEAAELLAKAKEALDKAEKAGMDESYPLFKEAKDAYDQALEDFLAGKNPESMENSKKVLDLLSDANVEKALQDAKDAAEAAQNKEKAAKDAIEAAKERLDYAKSAGLDENDENYKNALDYYNQAVEDFNNGKYEEAKDNADQVLALLPLEEIDGILAAKKAAAEEALAKAKDALDNAKEIGLSPLNEDYQEAVSLYADAKDAYDNGDYDTAKTDAEKVLELLDPETVKNMKAKADAEAAISKARERLTAAYAAGLDSSFEPYNEALSYYREAQKDFADEDYVGAKENADKVADLLSDEAIDAMLDQVEAEKAKSAAEGALAAAKERLDYAESLGLGTDDDKYKSALAYYEKALKEFEDGDYPESTDDAEEVLNILSDDYLANLIARSDAEKAIAAAKERLDYAESINAARDFPIAFDAAKAYYAQALDDYTAEQYEKAIADANKVLDALADIHEMSVLPKFYIVRPWAESKDCFWNISGRSYVYNNPWLWENLYEANKDNIPERDNPNLILPGMKMEIPSISGEYRDGVYSPDVEYGTFSTNR